MSARQLKVAAAAQLILPLVAIVAIGCSQDQPAAAACALPAPSFAAAAPIVPFTTAPNSELRLGFASADNTATIVGFCSDRPTLLSNAPDLLALGVRYRAVGGILSSSPGIYANYFLYPATPPTVITVVAVTTVVGQLTVSNAPATLTRSCPVSNNPAVTVTACGALVLADWDSHLPFHASEINLFDAQVTNQAAPIGFYLESVSDGRNGLVIRFGFQPPQQLPADLTVTANGVYLINQTDNKLGKPIQAAFALQKP